MKQKKASFIYLPAAIGAAFIWGFLTMPLNRLFFDLEMICSIFKRNNQVQIKLV
jgi:hypothetical protein